jgi:phage-related protein
VKKLRVVEFYRSADGTKPVGEWLDQLDDERAQAVAMGVKFFEEYPSLTVPKKFFEKVRGEIWEIKAHYGDEQFRLYSFWDGALVIAAVGVQKKWQKARTADLDLADQRRKEHFLRKKQRSKTR